MEEPVRVRLVFEDRHVLRKSQRSEGLRRCWILLRPELTTISEFSSHIAHLFSLHSSCPHGLVLSMDDFVLPTFESTCIFKDKDIIRLRKKGGSVKEVIEIGDDGHQIQDSDIVEKQHKLSSNRPLAIKEFQEDSDGYENKDEGDACTLHENTIFMENHSSENTNSKRKRKHSNTLQGSKRKKLKSTTVENPDITTDNAEANHIEPNQSCSQERVTARKSSHSKNKLSGGRSEAFVTFPVDNSVKNLPISVPREERRKKLKSTSIENPDITNKNGENNHIQQNESCYQKEATARKILPSKNKLSNLDDSLDEVVTFQVENNVTNISSSVPREERLGQVDIICKGNTCDVHANGVIRKLPSRSARRKKSKREWLREVAKSQMKEISQPVEGQVPANDILKESPKCQKMDQNNEIDGEMVPIIVRPGHIRFEPVDAEQSKQQSNGRVETLEWNGTTSKKKGQKWGREKSLSWRDDNNGCNEESNEKFIAGDANLVDDHTDFESLCHLTRLPKEGDVIVYRMVELSSSWCPELSSFRVGKVTSYDSISMRITLDPVPEYPIFHGERKDEESIVQPNVSAYREDGSIVIDYPSLVDVRLLKGNNTSDELTVTAVPKETAEKAAPVSGWDSALVNNSGSVREKSLNLASPAEKRQDMGWEQIHKALNEKKAELQKGDGWDRWAPTKDTTTPPWSYRSLRRSALGPTVAYLRARRGR